MGTRAEALVPFLFAANPKARYRWGRDRGQFKEVDSDMRPFLKSCLAPGILFSALATAQIGKLQTQDRRSPITFWEARGSLYLGLLDDEGVPACSFGLVGPRLISTAQHCFQGRDLTKIKVLLHFDGKTYTLISDIEDVVRLSPQKPAKAGEVGRELQKSWPMHNAHGGDDQLLVVLKESFGEHFGWLEVFHGKLPIGSKVDLLGYPADKKPNPWGHFDCQTVKSIDFPELNREDSYVYSLDCDVDYGMSGGPVISYLPEALPLEDRDRPMAHGHFLPNLKEQLIPYLIGTTTRVQKGHANSAQDMSRWHLQWSVLVISQLLDLMIQHSTRYALALPSPFEGEELLKDWLPSQSLEKKIARIDAFFAEKITKGEITANHHTARYVRAIKTAWERYRFPPLTTKFGIRTEGLLAPLKVRSVAPNSFAEKAGVKVGQTIRAFGKYRHPALHQITQEMADWSARGGKVPPTILLK